jgi:hypothetical protein
MFRQVGVCWSGQLIGRRFEACRSLRALIHLLIRTFINPNLSADETTGATPAVPARGLSPRHQARRDDGRTARAYHDVGLS